MKNKKLIALATAIVLSVQTGFATNISGVSGSNGVFNINPEMLNGSTGLRRYEHFYLSDGDVANLIMKLGGKDIGTFINLVDNKVNIQGILNTMRDGQFVDGHAVFISPKGMVVGQNGVLNVGSLSVLTPSQDTFNTLKQDPMSVDLSNLQGETNGEILMRGKILSRGDVNLRASKVILPENSAIVNGVKENVLISSLSQASDILFNNLVNTDNLSKANTLSENDGKIILKSSSQDGMLNVRGTVQNLNNGEVKFISDGNNGNIKVTGDIYNANGNMVVDGSSVLLKGKLTNDGGLLSLNNRAGKLHINSGAKVNSNTGSLRIVNNGAGGMSLYGDVVASDGDMYIENTNGKLYVASDVDYDGSGNAHIINTSSAGQLMLAGSGKISSNKNMYIKNESNKGLFVNGNIKVQNDLTLDNKDGDLTVNNNVKTTNGNLSLINSGNKLAISSKSSVEANGGDLTIKNLGKNGLTSYGNINSNGNKMYIENSNGKLYIAGNVDHKGSGDAHIINTSSAGQLMLAKSGKINSSKNIYMKNESNDGLFVNGSIESTKDLVLDNKAGDLTVNNSVKTTDGNLSLMNTGNKLSLSSKSLVEANGGDLTIKNEGSKDLLIYGNVKSNGKNTYIENNREKLYIAGNIEHKGSGDAHILNGTNAGQLMIAKSGKINSDKNVYIKNEGKGGLYVNGLVESLNDLTLDNRSGDLTVNNNLKTTNGNLSLMNTGNKLAVSSKASISGKGGNLVIKNEGNNGLLIYGDVENDGETISIRNTSGNLTVNGKIDAKSGNIGIINEGNLLQLTKNSVVENALGKTNIVNNGAGGMKAYGKITGNDDISLVNENGHMYVDGEIKGNKSKIGLYSQGAGKGIYIKKTAEISNIPADGTEKVGDVIIQDTSAAGGSGIIIRGDVKANNDVNITSIDNNIYTSGRVEGKNNVTYKDTAQNGKVSFTADSEVISGDGTVDYILKNNAQIYYLPAYDDEK